VGEFDDIMKESRGIGLFLWILRTFVPTPPNDKLTILPLVVIDV